MICPIGSWIVHDVLVRHNDFEVALDFHIFDVYDFDVLIGHLLVFCNVTNKIRKRTDTVVAFTQVYSRVSYPLGNVSTLPTGSGCLRTHTHWCRRIGKRGLSKIQNLCLEEEITSPLYFKLKISTGLNKPIAPIIVLYPISERGGLLRLEQGCHHLPATSTNRGTIGQLSGIVQPRHHVYAFSY